MKNGKSGQLEIRPNLRHYQSIRVSLSAPRILLLPRTLKTITAHQCLETTHFEKGLPLPHPLFKIIIDEKGVTDAYEDRPIKNLWEVKIEMTILSRQRHFFKKILDLDLLSMSLQAPPSDFCYRNTRSKKLALNLQRVQVNEMFCSSRQPK